MEQIKDNDVSPLWAEHFPKRNESEVSKALCLALTHTIRNRAQEVVEYGSWLEKLQYALTILHVPKGEFFQFEDETEHS